MYCNKCGNEVKEGVVYCGSCGSPTNNVNSESPASGGHIPPTHDNNRYDQQMKPVTGQRTNNTLILFIILVAVIVISAVIIAILVLKPFGLDSDTDKSEPADVYIPPTITASPSLTPTPPPKKESTYVPVKADVTWWEAYQSANTADAHLATINSEVEFQKATSIAYDHGIRVLWVGASRTESSTWDNTRWITGEPITYTRWFTNEPSYYDENAEQETYLMIFYVNGSWYYNDSVNDVSGFYKGKIGFVTEYE